MAPQRLLNTRQVADYLGCSPKHVSRLTRDQGLRCIRLGSLLRYRQEDIEAFLALSTQGSPPSPSNAQDAS